MSEVGSFRLGTSSWHKLSQVHPALFPAGLKDNIMLPVYGLAENCLGVSFHEVGKPIKSLNLNTKALQDNHVVLARKGNHL